MHVGTDLSPDQFTIVSRSHADPIFRTGTLSISPCAEIKVWPRETKFTRPFQAGAQNL